MKILVWTVLCRGVALSPGVRGTLLRGIASAMREYREYLNGISGPKQGFAGGSEAPQSVINNFVEMILSVPKFMNAIPALQGIPSIPQVSAPTPRGNDFSPVWAGVPSFHGGGDIPPPPGVEGTFLRGRASKAGGSCGSAPMLRGGFKLDDVKLQRLMVGRAAMVM